MIVPVKCQFPYWGTLALAGSGEYLPPMEAVDQGLLDKLGQPARVVCLPTAAGTEGEGRLHYWMKLGEDHFRRLGVESVESLPVFSRDDALNPDLIQKVRDANFVYLSGGKPYYLLECLVGTGMLDAILGTLESGGVVAGCSAGAMIFGERIPNRLFLGGTTPALGLLPGHFIIPHFDEVPFAMRFAVPYLVGELRMLGIEANTVLKCSNDEFTVAGMGGVTLAFGKEKNRYLEG
jgi:cyanophycinase